MARGSFDPQNERRPWKSSRFRLFENARVFPGLRRTINPQNTPIRVFPFDRPAATRAD
jgi:hypothetical protein